MRTQGAEGLEDGAVLHFRCLTEEQLFVSDGRGGAVLNFSLY